MYGPTVGTGYVMEYLSQTGSDILKGADVLKTAPEKYSSTVEYANTPIAQSLKGVAQVHLAGLGTRVLYTEYGNFDTHANELATHEPLWQNLSAALVDFYDDLKEHNASDNVVMGGIRGDRRRRLHSAARLPRPRHGPPRDLRRSRRG